MVRELREQMSEKAGKLPDAVVEGVGGGLNGKGAFYLFVNDGLDKEEHNCATLTKRTPGFLQRLW